MTLEAAVTRTGQSQVHSVVLMTRPVTDIPTLVAPWNRVARSVVDAVQYRHQEDTLVKLKNPRLYRDQDLVILLRLKCVICFEIIGLAPY